MAPWPWDRMPNLTGTPPRVPADVEEWPNTLPPAQHGGLTIGGRRDVSGQYAMGAPNRVAQSPKQFPPSPSTYFKVEGTVTGVNAATGEVEIGRFAIPVGNVAVIGNVIVSAQNTAGTSNIMFRLKENSAVIQGWDPTIVPQTAAAVSQGYDGEFVRIPFNDGSLVTLTAQVFDAGGPYDLFGQALGYFYSKEIQNAWDAGQ